MTTMNSDLPEPLVPPEVDLRGYEWVPLYGDRLFNSETWLLAGDAGRSAMLQLWWKAFAHEVPAGSLPDNDRLLSVAAGLGIAVAAWKPLREEALRGWIKCSDGRLYHPFVAKLALQAWETRSKDSTEKQSDRERKRAKREAERAKRTGGAEGPPDTSTLSGPLSGGPLSGGPLSGGPLSGGSPPDDTGRSAGHAVDDRRLSTGHTAPVRRTSPKRPPDTGACPPDTPPLSAGNPPENALKGQERRGQERDPCTERRRQAVRAPAREAARPPPGDPESGPEGAPAAPTEAVPLEIAREAAREVAVERLEAAVSGAFGTWFDLPDRPLSPADRELLEGWIAAGTARGLDPNGAAEAAAEEVARQFRRLAEPGGAGPPRSLRALLDEDVRRAIASARPRGPRMAEGPRESDELARWRLRLEGWRSGRVWLAGWGAPPGEAGCEAPAHLLAEVLAALPTAERAREPAAERARERV